VIFFRIDVDLDGEGLPDCIGVARGNGKKGIERIHRSHPEGTAFPVTPGHFTPIATVGDEPALGIIVEYLLVSTIASEHILGHLSFVWVVGQMGTHRPFEREGVVTERIGLREGCAFIETEADLPAGGFTQGGQGDGGDAPFRAHGGDGSVPGAGIDPGELKLIVIGIDRPFLAHADLDQALEHKVTQGDAERIPGVIDRPFTSSEGITLAGAWHQPYLVQIPVDIVVVMGGEDVVGMADLCDARSGSAGPPASVRDLAGTGVQRAERDPFRPGGGTLAIGGPERVLPGSCADLSGADLVKQRGWGVARGHEAGKGIMALAGLAPAIHLRDGLGEFGQGRGGCECIDGGPLVADLPTIIGVPDRAGEVVEGDQTAGFGPLGRCGFEAEAAGMLDRDPHVILGEIVDLEPERKGDGGELGIHHADPIGPHLEAEIGMEDAARGEIEPTVEGGDGEVTGLEGRAEAERIEAERVAVGIDIAGRGGPVGDETGGLEGLGFPPKARLEGEAEDIRDETAFPQRGGVFGEIGPDRLGIEGLDGVRAGAPVQFGHLGAGTVLLSTGGSLFFSVQGFWAGRISCSTEACKARG